jgi:hypothetical protein
MARSDAEEVSAVLSASVVIQTEVGTVAHVAQRPEWCAGSRGPRH